MPRGPATIRVLRIGKHRDGTQARRPDPGAGPRPRVGAGDDHAGDGRAAGAQLPRPTEETKKIVNNTDIFLILSNNPDGANYSFYNFASQRRT